MRSFSSRSANEPAPRSGPPDKTQRVGSPAVCESMTSIRSGKGNRGGKGEFVIGSGARIQQEAESRERETDRSRTGAVSSSPGLIPEGGGDKPANHHCTPG